MLKLLDETLFALLAAVALFFGIMLATVAPPVIQVLLAALVIALVLARLEDARARRRPLR